MILLVARSKYYSRGREQADAAIIQSVQTLLQNRGYQTELIQENGLCSNKALFEQDKAPQIVLSMARNRASLLALAALQYNGSRIENPVTAVNLCRTRIKQWYVLRFINKSGLKGTVFNSVQQLKETWTVYPCWVKTDRKTYYVETPDSCPNVKGRFLVTQHVDGCVVKFYAVGTQIVGWYYVSASNSRFGEIAHNDTQHEYAFDLDTLKVMATSVASKTGLSIFGGDVIVSPDGKLTLIDVNDWPSFGPFREIAAQRIVDNLIKHYIDDGKEN